jgi:hypothetical protein
MAYREVRVYGGPFPTFDQMISRDPGAPRFPKEVWLPEVKQGEFAVRYKDFKTGLARNPQGAPVRDTEICRVFGDLAEARTNSLQVTKERWTVRCFIYDHTGALVESVSNTAEINKFALVMYVGILTWAVPFTLAGMALIWGAYRVTLFLLAPGREPIRSLGWLGWSAFAAAGLAVAVVAWLIKLRRRAGRRVSKIRASFTKEEMKKFEEINTLHGTADPVERERFLELTREYQQKIRDALKK